MDKQIKSKIFSRPDYFLAFGFGSGLFPFAPGTVGSLIGLMIFLPCLSFSSYIQLMIIVAGLLFGIWITDRVSREIGIKDPPAIVFDEFVGIWIAVFLLPHFLLVIPAFLLFRLFDIYKPWPISFFDQKLNGGAGIMLDDVCAGLLVFFVMQASGWCFSVFF